MDLETRAKLVHAFGHKFKVMPDGCWHWTAVRGGTKGQYGCLKRDRKMQYAHRISWELHRGQIPKGRWVLHHCDVPRCVNPAHLFLGTGSDNMVDCSQKGRLPARKLTAGQVQEIRARLAGGETHRGLALDFGIKKSSIGAIKEGRSYAWVN
jgi:hypothetical protein